MCLGACMPFGWHSLEHGHRNVLNREKYVDTTCVDSGQVVDRTKLAGTKPWGVGQQKLEALHGL